MGTGQLLAVRALSLCRGATLTCPLLTFLYGWRSDSAGIRNAIKDQSIVESADAQFMLVTCSAFVNYLYREIG